LDGSEGSEEGFRTDMIGGQDARRICAVKHESWLSDEGFHMIS